MHFDFGEELIKGWRNSESWITSGGANFELNKYFKLEILQNLWRMVRGISPAAKKIKHH